MEVSGPSLPSNYVTILDLKKRWLQQQQQQSSPKSNSNSNSNPPESDSPKPEHESASKTLTPTESIPPTTNPNPIVNQPKHDVTLHDSDSKTPNKTVYRERNHHRIVNQVKPEVKLDDSGSKTSDKHPIVEKKEHNSDQVNSKFSTTRNGFRRRNPRFVKGQTPTRGNNTPLSKPEPELEPERLQEKKQEYGADQSNSKLSKNKISSGNRNPRFVRGENPTGGSTPLLESEPEPEPECVREKKQEYGTDQSSSKHSKNKSNYSKRNPRFRTEQNSTGGSTALLESVPERVQEKKQECDTDRSNSGLSTNKNSSRGRNHKFVTDKISTGGNTPQLEPEGEPVLDKKQEYDTDRSNSKPSTKKNGYRSRNPRFVPAGGSTPLLESEPEQEREHVQEKKKQEYDTGRSNSEHSTNKNSFRSRNPRFATDQIPAAGSTQEPESEPVQEKKQKHKRKQHRYGDGRREQKEVGEPKDKTPPSAENVDGLSHNDSGGGGGGEVEDVVAAVKEISITDGRQRINRRWGSGSFNGGRRTRPVKPLFGVKRGQTAGTAIWVKKGESVPN